MISTNTKYPALAGLLLCSGSSLTTVPQKPIAKPVGPTFEKDIRPLFVAQCMGCHNRTTVGNAALSGGLALDSYDSTLRGVASPGQKARAVVSAAKPEECDLIARMEIKDASKRMPKGGDPLPSDKIAMIKKWMAAGMPRGVAAKGASPTLAAPVIPPGPSLEVIIPTTLAAPADMIPPKAPKDSKLAISLPIGPLAPITALAFSPDGKLLAAGTYKAIFLWNVNEGKVERTLFDPVGAVHALAWNKEGTRLAEAGGAPGSLGELRVYDAAAGYKQIALCTGHTDLIYGISFSPDGRTIASASHDKTVRTWETETGKPILTIKSHSDVVYKVSFATDGKSIFSCGQDKAIRQFDAAKGTPIRSFEGSNQAVTALAVSRDGKFIVTSGLEPRLRWWNVADGNTVRYSDGCGAQVNDIVFSPKGEVLAAASADHSVRTWNGNDGSSMKSFLDSPDWSYAVSVSPDSKLIAGGGADGLVRIWDNGSGAFRATFAAKADTRIKSLSTLSAVFTPGGYIAVDSNWIPRLALRIADQPPVSNSKSVLSVLLNPEMALKSLRGEKVDAPKLPAPAKGQVPTTATPKQS